MMLRPLLFALLGGASCTGTAPPGPEAPRAEAAAQAPEQPRAPRSTNGTPWIWYHEAEPPWFVDSPYMGIGVADHAILGEARVAARCEPTGLVVEVASRWRRTSAGDCGRPVVLATLDRGVYVGVQTPRGARVVGYSPGGELRFDVPLHDDSPLEIQLGLCDPGLCVYSAGVSRRVFRLDRETGKELGESSASGGPRVTVARPPKEASETKEFGAVWAYGPAGYRVIAEGGRAIVERHDGAAVKWRVALPEVQPHRDRAAVLEVEDASGQAERRMAVVVVHSPIASGAALFVLDAASGSLSARIDPTGIGPVEHSKYHNRVSVQAPGLGLVQVFGQESSGQYVATVDPAYGRVESNEIWRD